MMIKAMKTMTMKIMMIMIMTITMIMMTPSMMMNKQRTLKKILNFHQQQNVYPLPKQEKMIQQKMRTKPILIPTLILTPLLQ